MGLAPVALFVYKRFEHTKQVIDSLKKNILANDTELYIFSDGPKQDKDLIEINKIREYLESITGFKKVVVNKSEVNKGLAKSVIEGVSYIFQKNENIIVLEDDLVVSKDFLNYMNNGLEFYKDEPNIWSISGYNLPIKLPKNYKKDIYISPRGCSWGWATWKNRWNSCDWELKKSDIDEVKQNLIGERSFNYGGNDMIQMLENQYYKKIDSWAIRWCYNQFLQKKSTIYPVLSKVKNVGLDGTGTHSDKTTAFDIDLVNSSESIKFEKINTFNPEIIKVFRRAFERKSLVGTIIFFLKEIGVYHYLKNKI